MLHAADQAEGNNYRYSSPPKINLFSFILLNLSHRVSRFHPLSPPEAWALSIARTTLGLCRLDTGG